MIEPLRVDVDLACSAEHAFVVWTGRFAQWWPPGHSVTGDPEGIVLEPRLGAEAQSWRDANRGGWRLAHFVAACT